MYNLSNKMSISNLSNKIIVPNGIVVWLDVDDVLVDFHRFFNMHANRHGYNLPVDYKPAQYSYREIMSDRQFSTLFNKMPQQWVAQLDAHAGAAEFTKKLSEMGCRVILITSVHGHQGPERIKNLCRHSIYFDEIYLTKGREKSEFAGWLSTRYVSTRGEPVRNILVDDYAKNTVDFIRKVPSSYGVTLNVGYSKRWIKKLKGSRRLSSTAVKLFELYDNTLDTISRIIRQKK